MRKTFKKAMALTLAMSMVFSTQMMASAEESGVETGASKLVLVQDPMYLYDFEGTTGLEHAGTAEEANATITGDGTVVTDDERGKVFDNNSSMEAPTIRENYLSLPQAVIDSITGSVNKATTISMWVKAPVGSVMDTKNYAFHSPLVAMKQAGTTDSWPLVNVALKGTTQVNWGGWMDNTTNMDPSYVTDNKWHNVVATFSEVGTTVYVDGVVKNEALNTADNTVAGIFGADAFDTLSIGGDNISNWNDADAGLLFDDVAIYDYVLDETQVNAVINGNAIYASDFEKLTVIADPMYLYNFDGATGLENAGTSGEANAAIVGDGTIVTDDQRGKVFDNNSDMAAPTIRENYLSLPTEVAKAIAGSANKEVTISMWVKAPEGSQMDTKNYGFHSPLFAMKQSGGTDAWPLVNVALKGTTQVNCAGYLDNNANMDPSYVANNEWHNVVATFSEIGTTVYVDGVVTNSALNTDANTIAGMFGTDVFDTVSIGGDNMWGWNDADAGLLFDDVAIYDSILDETQVNAVINNTYIYESDSPVVISKEPTLSEATISITENNTLDVNYEKLFDVDTLTVKVNDEESVEVAELVAGEATYNIANVVAGTYNVTLTATKAGYVDCIKEATITVAIENEKVVVDAQLISGLSATKVATGYAISSVLASGSTVSYKVTGPNGFEETYTEATTIAFEKLSEGTYTVEATASKEGYATKKLTTTFTYTIPTVEPVYDEKVIGYYTFDETLMNEISKDTAATIGNKLGTPVGTSLPFAEGVNGKAVSFTGGATDGLLLDAVPNSKQYTIGFNIKYNAEQIYSPAALVISSLEPELWNSIGQGWQATLAAGPMVWGHDNVNKTPQEWMDLVPQTQNTVSVGTWAHITTVVDGTNGKLYVDGNLIAEGSVANVITATTKIYLGVNAWDLTLSADIDDFVLINTNITDAGVTALATAKGNPDGIVFEQDEVKPEPSKIAVTGVKLNKTSTTLVAGKTAQLTATVAPANATDKAVTWKSSKTSVATVSATGKVTAKKAGTVTITATTKDGSKVATCKIKVYAKTSKVSVKAAGYEASKITLVRGKKVTLKTTVTPKTAKQGVTYKSSKKSVATVSSKGVVKAKKAGKTTISVKSADGYKTKKIKVTVVKKKVANKKLSLKKTKATLKKKGSTVQITVKSLTKKTTDKITYKVISGKKYVKVDKYGKVTVRVKPAKKARKSVVRVKCGKVSKKFTVTIKK